MKQPKWKIAIGLFVLLVAGSPLFAQFDDLYYNPETDYVAVRTSESTQDYNNQGNQDYNQNYNQAPASNNNYDDQYATRIDDYDFHYSSRIRRFNRPMGGGFGFYDPYYVDRFHYDPFYQPGVSIYVNSGWNSFSPWNRRPWGYNRFGMGAGFGAPWCPQMGFGNPYAFNSMGMGFVRPMGFGMSPWGMNPYGGFGNTMIINNYYGGGMGMNYAGSDPWAMDNSYDRFSRLENNNRSARPVSYGPRTIGGTRGVNPSEGRNRDGLNADRGNYDQYPASRRRASENDGTTGRSQDTRRDAASQGRVDGRENAPETGRSRQATGRSSEATRSNPQEDARTQPQRTRRSLFNNNNSSRNNSRSTSPRSTPPSRSPGYNRSSSPSRSSGVNRSSRRSSRSSGVNRSSRSSSRSSGVNRSSRSSSSSSGSINRSSSSSRSSGSSSRSSRGGGRRG